MKSIRDIAEAAKREQHQVTIEPHRAENALSSQMDEMKALAFCYGLTVDETGGGCLAYAHHFDDGWYFWLTHADGTSLPTRPDDGTCLIGIYNTEGDWWLNSTASPTQAACILKTLHATAKTRKAAGHPETTASLKSILAMAVEANLVASDEAELVTAILQGQDPATRPSRTWRTEFPNFHQDWVPPLPEGFEDRSWHNDTCPSFQNYMTDIVLWVDYPNPADRDNEGTTRFAVCRELDDGSLIELFSSDKWLATRQFIELYDPRLHPPPHTTPCSCSLRTRNARTRLTTVPTARTKQSSDSGRQRQAASPQCSATRIAIG